jgi:circadian clock protein KaiC
MCAAEAKKTSDLPRLATGIEGLDKILKGGIPAGNTVLITGACGTGKTTLSAEFLVNGAKNNENSIFITVTETAAKLIENLSTYNFFDKGLIKKESLTFMEMSEIYQKAELDPIQFEHKHVGKLIDTIVAVVKEKEAKRVVIDSITGICFQLETKEKIRDFIFQLKKGLSTSGVTTLLVSEIPPESIAYSSHGVEDAIADGIIMLGNIEQRGHLLRTLHVVKMRGTTHSRAKYVMDLSSYGIILVPLLKASS